MIRNNSNTSNKWVVAICNGLKIALLFLGLANLVLAGYLVHTKEPFAGFVCLLGGIYAITAYISYYNKKIV